MLRLAIDTGGTFTDFVLRDEASRASWFAKTLSTPLRPSARHPGGHRSARLGPPVPARGRRPDPDRDDRRDQRHPGTQGRAHRPRDHSRIPGRAHHGPLQALRHLRPLARQAPPPRAAAGDLRGGRAHRPRRGGVAAARPRIGGGGGGPDRRRRGGERGGLPPPRLRQPGPRTRGRRPSRGTARPAAAKPAGVHLPLLGRVAPPPRVRADQHRRRQRIRQADRRPVPRRAGGRLRLARIHGRASHHAIQRGAHDPHSRPGVSGQHHRVGTGRRGAREPRDRVAGERGARDHVRHGRHHRQGRGHRRRRAGGDLHVRGGRG